MNKLRFCLPVLLILFLILAASGEARAVPVDFVSIEVVKSPRPHVPGIHASPTPASLTLGPGETTELAVRIFPSNATYDTSQYPQWRSTDPKVATVRSSSNAIVTVVGTGVTDIVVSVGNATDRLRITVTADPDGLAAGQVDVERLILSSNRIDNLQVGDTVTLTADVYPTNARLTDIRWRSSNDTIARVSTTTSSVTAAGAESRAVIRAEGVGTAEVTVYVDYGTGSPISDTCVIVVGAAPAARPTAPATPATGGAAATNLPAAILALTLAGSAALLVTRRR